jgi:hypothetical protein
MSNLQREQNELKEIALNVKRSLKANEDSIIDHIVPTLILLGFVVLVGLSVVSRIAIESVGL